MSVRRVSAKPQVSVEILAVPQAFNIRVRVTTATMVLESGEMAVSPRSEEDVRLLTALLDCQTELSTFQSVPPRLPAAPLHPREYGGFGGGTSLSEDDRRLLSDWHRECAAHSLDVKRIQGEYQSRLAECAKAVSIVATNARSLKIVEALMSQPVALRRVDRPDERCFAVYHDQLWASLLVYSAPEWMQLIEQNIDREKHRLDRILGRGTETRVRMAIPTSVRRAVWTRDAGQCVRCGSRNRLEFDHIIPISLGGSTTERNFELLCEACNRAKSAEIG
jgi:hypothetical protein